MKKIIFAILFIWLATNSSATIINIPADWPAIQQGIDASVDGDTVLVADGTYTGVGNRDIDFGGKAILVRSLNGPITTIINCDGAHYDEHRGFIFQSGETSASILSGFTIQNGWALWDGPNGERLGGAIYCTDASFPQISNCIFQDNYAADEGGAVYCRENSPVLFSSCEFVQNSSNKGGGIGGHNSNFSCVNCNFINNMGETSGGAVYCSRDSVSSDINLTECTFTGNTAGDGGALLGWCTAYITSCTFNDNSAAGNGGAINSLYGSLNLVDCIFQNNTSGGWGAGIRLGFGTNIILHSTFYRNTGIGGGAFCQGFNTTIAYCLFIENSGRSGGALGCSDGSPRINNCTFFENSATNGGGAAIYCIPPSSPIFENCIIAFSPQGEAIYGGTSTLSYSNIYGNAGGDWVGYISPQLGTNGNISQDPLFRDSINNDIHLMSIACGDSADSPCIDAGDPNILDSLLDCSWGLGGLRSDMGAYGGGDSAAVGIFGNMPPLPDQFVLLQNYPNPFNAQTTIRFVLPESQDVELTIYDLLGRRVGILIDEYMQTGAHAINFDGSGLSSGVYFYRLQAGKKVETKRMILLK